MDTYRNHPVSASTTFFAILVALVLAFSSSLSYGGGTRFAVAAEGAGAEAAVSGIAARAPYILLFEADGKFAESQRNPFATAAGDAGPPLASWLAERQVGSFIAGAFGSKLSQAMKDKGIREVVAHGSAAAVKGAQR
jgi:predicted Fe-Mo cluster-binding NifX family protein